MTYTGLITISNAEERLERLMQERLIPGSDKDAIDRRIWDLFGEEWTVICTDLSGFSRNVSDFGIIHFLQTIVESQRIFVPVIEHYDGILLKVEADSLMLIFRNVIKAVECAFDMVYVARKYNVNRPDKEHILLCVGIGTGIMLRIGEHDVYGEEVNSASKLGEDRAKAWEILVTDAVRRGCGDGYGLTFVPLEDVPSGVGTAHRLTRPQTTQTHKSV